MIFKPPRQTFRPIFRIIPDTKNLYLISSSWLSSAEIDKIFKTFFIFFEIKIFIVIFERNTNFVKSKPRVKMQGPEA